jgi:hypothetical protein
VNRGYAEEDVAVLAHVNWLRVLRETRALWLVIEAATGFARLRSRRCLKETPREVVTGAH